MIDDYRQMLDEVCEGDLSTGERAAKLRDLLLDAEQAHRDFAADILWMERGACVGKNPSWWFDYHNEPEVERARRICNGCPVKAECLEHAMTNRIDDHGMFGGYTENERRRIRRGRPPMPAVKDPPPPKVTTGDRILALLAERPMTAVELQERLGFKQNTVARWTGALRREGSITWSEQPGSKAWLYQIGGGGPSS